MADGFGIDVDTTGGLDTTGRMISGVRVVMVMALRRLTTPRGSLAYDTDFGFDLREYVDDDLDAADLLNLQTQIAAELVKDERVISCRATVILVDSVMQVRIGIYTTDGNYAFTLGISDVNAEILQDN